MKVSLLDMETELATLTDQLLGYQDGEEPPEELLTAIAGGITATAEKRDRVAGFLRFVEAQPLLISAEIKRLQARKQAIERGAARLRGYVQRVMDATNQKVLEGNVNTFKLVKNPPAVEVSDMSALPGNLIRLDCSFTVTQATYDEIKGELNDLIDQIDIKASPDKKRIADRLKAKEQVPGAKLTQGERLEIS